MNVNNKKSNITMSLYIILALCIISVAALSVYAFFIRQSESDRGYGLENVRNTDGGAESTSDNLNDGREELLKIFGTEEAAKTTPDIPDISVKEETLPNITEPASASAGEPDSAEPPTVPAAEINEVVQIAVPVAAEEDAGAMNAVEVFAAPSVFIKPVQGMISKPYNDEHPEYSVVMNDYRTHMGIDIESEIGANVKAAADGIISEITSDPLMGKTVVISHPGDIESLYMNLQESLPQNIVVGAVVSAGDVIGGVGESALIEVSDVPHLHFAMRKDGSYVNPVDYVKY